MFLIFEAKFNNWTWFSGVTASKQFSLKDDQNYAEKNISYPQTVVLFLYIVTPTLFHVHLSNKKSYV